MESKGNGKSPHGNSSAVLSTLHWGPHSYLNKYFLTQDQVISNPDEEDFSDSFHTYGLEWTKEGLRTYVDEKTILQVDFDKPAWDRGEFTKPTMNPWRGGDISAPFDQEFYLVNYICIQNYVNTNLLYSFFYYRNF
jgi:beta-glucanase (GH16 family)